MKYTKLEISDVVLCEPLLHNDNRGFVYESYKKVTFNDFLGFEVNFCQDNILYNNYGVIRGLHTNTPSFVQSKLISVLKGQILDVAVDFRIGSPTFGKSVSVELSSKNKKQLFVPKGFLHGFSVLSSDAIVMIKIDNYLANGQSIGIKYDDDFLNIDWKIQKEKVILSDSDNKLSKFKEILSPFNYEHNYYTKG